MNVNPVYYIVLFSVIVAVCGYAISKRLSGKKNSDKGLDRTVSRRRDTELNIGGRFANLIRGILSDNMKYVVTASHSERGGYSIIVKPFIGPEEILSFVVNLKNPEHAQISGKVGRWAVFNEDTSEASLEKVRQKIVKYVKTL